MSLLGKFIDKIIAPHNKRVKDRRKTRGSFKDKEITRADFMRGLNKGGHDVKCDKRGCKIIRKDERKKDK